MATNPKTIAENNTFCENCGSHSEVIFTSEYEDHMDSIGDYVSNPVELAKKFHHYYETLAPSYGYDTRKDTQNFKPDSPNGKLMTAVCSKILDLLFPNSLNR